MLGCYADHLSTPSGTSYILLLSMRKLTEIAGKDFGDTRVAPKAQFIGMPFFPYWRDLL